MINFCRPFKCIFFVQLLMNPVHPLPASNFTMKKIFLIIAAACLLLTGCLETTQEITLKEDGSGTFSTTSDMGSILGMARQLGDADKLEEAGGKVMDTTIMLGAQADSIPGLTTLEKELLKQGSMNMKFDFKNEEFKTKLDFPFSNPDEIKKINNLTGKLFLSAMKNQIGESPMAGGMKGEIPALSSFDDYYILEFSDGELKKKLNKEKYSSVSSDEYLNGLKEAASMGIPVGATYIINLPRPAEKAEGKKVKLSDDKRKVTVKVELDDFFDDPEKLEFKIKY